MQEKKKLRKAHYYSDVFFSVFCSTNVIKQLALGLHKVTHGIIKGEATYPPLFSKFNDMISLLNSLCSDDSSVKMFFYIFLV